MKYLPMQLTYRGVQYLPSNETVNFKSILQPEKVYRGVCFQAKQGQSRLTKRGIQLTYRGVNYTI
ncbi:DUF4278 domain-containing protein [Leptothoe sp. PORK10 BA2]|uniref:DUF4278 domain-containing protein n=1 Tax=Leptothoe sp. PORK10 BA2 TaxID=3110254 RepID=UPI002B1FB3C1|nr:DUF4278 domain-containing protein [Leptothoe sp. PORK10 BA2]MEA5464765.1 DUF4278 domain-containing protein [Leptothoe sp. PORK10 BA2]